MTNYKNHYAYSKSASDGFKNGATYHFTSPADGVSAVAHHINHCMRDGDFDRLPVPPREALQHMTLALFNLGDRVKQLEADLYIARRPRSIWSLIKQKLTGQ